MPRLKFLGAFALVAAMTSLQARAAAPALPPDVIAADTIAVVHVDSAHFNPDQLQSAATAVLGANANKVDEQIKQFKAKYDKAAAAGAEAITLVSGAPKKADAAAPAAPAAPGAAPAAEEKNDGNPIFYIQLKPGADAKAIEAMITEDMPAAEKDKTLFDQAGNFLAVHQKGQAFPVTPDAARTAIFTEALGTISEGSIQIAFVPDQNTRNEMLKNLEAAPKGLKDATPILAKAKWMTLSINLGNNPGISATANAASDADAKALSDSINTSLTDLKAQAANPGPNAGALALVGPLVGQLIDGLKPTTTGTQVTVALKTDTLKMIAGFAANMGMLGAGPGGAGAPPQ
ncbi:MAG TPA: hypothetical protein VFE47_25075 [Tepidisphaeraceae bacterium]|jgi:hypothetical protein|nr:hypothetical protein [Tepidisphaeraceae bacterium]